MPDLWLLTASFVTAMLTAGLVCLATLPRAGRSVSGHRGAVRPQLAALSGLASGVLSGMAMQGIVPALPLVSGLDRWLAIGLPLLLLADVVCCCWSLQRSARWLRFVGAVCVAPIILFGSVHLRPVAGEAAWGGVAASGLMTLVTASTVMILLTMLAGDQGKDRSLTAAAYGIAAGSILLSLQVAAIVVMLGGWIGCGAAVLPLTGAGGGVMLTGIIRRQQAVLIVARRWACWGLGGVILLGHFFGRLTERQAAVLLFAAAVASLPISLLSGYPRRQSTAVCFLLALLMLAGLLIPAIVEFQRRMASLLS